MGNFSCEVHTHPDNPLPLFQPTLLDGSTLTADGTVGLGSARDRWGDRERRGSRRVTSFDNLYPPFSRTLLDADAKENYRIFRLVVNRTKVGFDHL